MRRGSAPCYVYASFYRRKCAPNQDINSINETPVRIHQGCGSNQLAVVWLSESNKGGGEQPCLDDLGISCYPLRSLLVEKCSRSGKGTLAGLPLLLLSGPAGKLDISTISNSFLVRSRKRYAHGNVTSDSVVESYCLIASAGTSCSASPGPCFDKWRLFRIN